MSIRGSNRLVVDNALSLQLEGNVFCEWTRRQWPESRVTEGSEYLTNFCQAANVIIGLLVKGGGIGNQLLDLTTYLIGPSPALSYLILQIQVQLDSVFQL